MKSLLLTLVKYVSLPFALLYGFIIFIRNKFYDWKIFSSIEFSIPIISVGNITVGGTGKSPHIEYLIELLSQKYKIATLSRGYRRHTRGFKLANLQSDAREIGDEPFQFKSKFPLIEVAVAEERMTAIPQLLQTRHDLQVILLDDAYQHRTVKPGLNILLSDYNRMYTRDYIMPFGLLRESRKASERADLILVTKCPQNLSEIEKNKLINEIKPLSEQQIFFSTIQYKNLYPLTAFTNNIQRNTEVLLVTGIANPKPLEEHLKKQFSKVHNLEYKDHHYFTFDDLEEIKQTFESLTSESKIIVTTEKDAARLMLLKEKINEFQLPFYAQSIGIEFLFNQQEQFNEQITEFIKKYFPDDYDEIIDCEEITEQPD